MLQHLTLEGRPGLGFTFNPLKGAMPSVLLRM
jgi:hypothetical protein